MPEREIIIDQLNGITRRLVIEDRKAVEYAISLQDGNHLVGNVYLGRVINIVKGIGAAFVDIGCGKNAFLPLQDIPAAVKDEGSLLANLQENRVKPGQEIIVQVIKDAVGDKGPRVTMHPTFPGEYVVILPTVDSIGVSRHIENAEMRLYYDELAKKVKPVGQGVIIRTAAEGIDAQVIEDEVNRLSGMWGLLQARSQTAKPPVCLYDDNDFVAATKRDLPGKVTVGEIDAQWETKLAADLRRKVWLKCGGYLVFDTTEALTVIDVNSGRFEGKRTQKDSFLKLNLEAAQEIARLLRLRDIAGIVIIDFVDMNTEADRQTVCDAFEAAMKPDRAKRHVHGFTQTGLLELTRRAVYKPLAHVLHDECVTCHGTGATDSALGEAIVCLADVRRKRNAGDTSRIALQLSLAAAEILQQMGMPENTIYTIRPETKGNCNTQ